jgi:hypothetical protein
MANFFDQFDAQDSSEPAAPQPSSPAPKATSTPADFAATYGPAAQRAGQRLNVDPNTLLGQWGLETGWGKSVIPGTNNLGNIKDFSGSGVAATDNLTGSQDKYRSFASPDEFADHYAGLIERKYPGAIGAGSDAAKFAGALAAGGYAEDPRYANKVVAAANTVGKAGNPVLRAANAVTDALLPSANAAAPASGNFFDQFDTPAAPASAPAAQPAPQAGPTAGDKIIKGMRDPIDGGAQLLTKMLPDAVVQAGNQFNNWLADKTGLVGKLPEGGVAQQVADSEKAYQAQRAAAGDTGFDGMRTLGNILSPANLAIAARAPQAVSLGGRILSGIGSGAVSGALNPVASDDFWADKGKQVGMGAAIGGAVPAIASGIARVVSPNASVNPNVQLLKDEGVNPTIGQTLGGWANATEEKLQSVPILGDMIRRARGQAQGEFNTAAINRATSPIGVTTQGAGQDAVKAAGDALSDAYNNALSQVQHVPFDQQFHGQLAQLQGMAQNMVPSMASKFNKTLNDIVLGRVGPQGSMLGSTYKDVDSELGRIASRYGKSQMASEQEYGDAVAQLQNLLGQQMRRANPQVAQQLEAADQGWANLVRVEGAAKAAQNNEGVFTPAQLNAAIRSGDDSVRGRAVSRGDALMQDLGNAGQQVLGNKVPNSGTADRMWAGAGALASGLLHPAIPASLAVGGAMYTRPMQALLNAAVSARPAVAQPTADAIRRLSGPAAALLAPSAANAATNDKKRAYADGGMIDDGEESASAATKTRRSGEAIGLESMGYDTQELGYANGGMIGEDDDDATKAAKNSILQAAMQSRVASSLVSNGGNFINGTGQPDNYGAYNLAGLGLAPNATSDSPLHDLMSNQASTVHSLFADSAFNHGSGSKIFRSFKNGGMIGASAMDSPVRALAFGRSTRRA